MVNLSKLKKDIIFTETLRGMPMTFHSTWGIFSPREVDEGSRLLIEHVELPRGINQEINHTTSRGAIPRTEGHASRDVQKWPSGTGAKSPLYSILEIGCGYGPIGLTLAKYAPQGTTHLVDKDFVAVEYTKKNALLNGIHVCEVYPHTKDFGVRVYLSNGFSHVPDQKFDLIVSNLPAKAGNEFYTILFHDANVHLKPGGRLVVVTLSGMREYIKRSFKEIFGNYTKVKQGQRYTVSMATTS